MAFNREKALTAAAKFVSKGQHDRAAKEYIAIIEADPNDTRSWLLLAEALTNANDKPGAIERYLHVAEGYAATNEAQKAIAVYRKVLALDPNRLDIQTRIAGLYKDLGRPNDAVAAYEFVAQAYFQAGQIAEGLEGFRMVAELEPAAVGKRLRLAELYSREGMVAQAVEHFRLAADRLLTDRRTDDYIRVAERLIYHKEDDLPVLRSLAQIYLKQGENRRALVKLNALLRAAPADAEGLELLGETFVAIGKVDKAISVVMELAREQRKGNRKAKETAARVLRKALAWNPENAEDIRKIATEIEAEVAALPPDPEPGDDKPKEEGMDLDVDVVEDEAAASSTDLDIDVDIDEDEEVRKVEEVPSRPFAPVGANVAPSAVEDGEEGVGDVEKILLEARVYVKYKMFEHALGHLDAVFVRDANHVAALELQAQILMELGRNADAADSFVRLAQLVSSTDLKQARAHLEQAQKLVPDHTKADMVLAALDSGDSGGGGETAPLVNGLQASLQGDPTSESAVDPQEPAVKPAESVTAETKPDAATPTEPADAHTDEAASAKHEPAETDAAPTDTVKTDDASDAAKPDAVAEVAADSDAKSADASTSSSTSSSTDEPAAVEADKSTDVSVKTDAATPSPDEPDAHKADASVAADEPTAETPATSKPEITEASAARRFAELSGGPTEGSAARKLPTERTPLPVTPLLKTFGEKTPLPKTPLPTRFGEGTPLPTFKPPPPETVSRAASEAEAAEAGETADAPDAPAAPSPSATTDEDIAAARPRPAGRKGKPPGTALATPTTPTQPSPEIEELDSGVIEELDADEVAEMVEVVEPVKPTRAKAPKAPPKRPPAKRPPPPKRAPPPSSDDSKAEAAPEDSKAQPVPEDSKSETVLEDSKAQPVPEDSKSEAAPEDSKSEAAPEDSKSQPVPEDSKSEAAPEDSKSAVAPEDSKSQPVPEDSKSQPVPEDSKAEAAPEASDAQPVPEDSKSAPPEASDAQPVPEDSKPEVPADQAQPVPEDSKPEDARIAPEAAEIAADVAPAGERAETDELVLAVPVETADAPAKSDEAKSSDKPEIAEAPTTVEADEPREPGPGDTAMLAIDAVLAPEPTWPDITDEIEELRFFISGRFEDDAQFAGLDLQRRFPGHPGLLEFADRLATGAKLESAAAPVMLDDPRPPSTPSRGASPAKVALLDDDDDDEDTFLASIFDEPVLRAPGKSAKPRRAVASLDDAADPQTFFDLGTAYREMGLDDDALAQFDLAAKDPRWTARARIMSASLRIQRGEHAQAIDDLNLAIDFATDVDQRSEAGYELGVLYQANGDQASAIEALAAVTPGYRDRDQRLEMLEG